MKKKNEEKALSLSELKDIIVEVSPEIEPRIKGISSPFQLWRYDRGLDRYYFEFPENGDPLAYLSVTSFTSKCLGIGQQLFDWAVKSGEEYSKMYAQVRADYGTNLHAEITQVVKDGKGDFLQIANRAFNLAMDYGYKTFALDWASDTVNDVASFLIFAKEKNFQVVAAEFPLASREFGLGGCTDLIGELDFGRKRVKAILDIKSGRKGFFPAHELQLHTYKNIWNDLFSDVFEVTHVFNFAPQNIHNKAKYKLKNQTSSVFAETCRSRMALARAEGWVKPPKQHTEIVGKFEYDTFDINDHINKKLFKYEIKNSK